MYRVDADVRLCTHDARGNERRFVFPAGIGRPSDDDEWFVLEHVLIPAGLAVRVNTSRS